MSIHEKPVFLSGLGVKEKTVEATTRWKYCLFFSCINYVFEIYA